MAKVKSGKMSELIGVELKSSQFNSRHIKLQSCQVTSHHHAMSSLKSSKLGRVRSSEVMLH